MFTIPFACIFYRLLIYKRKICYVGKNEKCVRLFTETPTSDIHYFISINIMLPSHV